MRASDEHEKKREEQRRFWNARAATFPRFEEGPDTYEAGMLRRAREMGADFSGKRILDVGCGAGMYTIRLAREAKSVLALDFSEAMLDILRKDAARENAGNIRTLLCAWQDFTCDETFDLVFAAMAPAVSDDADREKLLRCSHGQVLFMGYARREPSNVMAGLLAHYGLPPHTHANAKDMRTWLDRKGLAYKAEAVSGEWVVPWSADRLTEACAANLLHYKAKADPALIARHIEAFADGQGRYIERTRYLIEIILWNAA